MSFNKATLYGAVSITTIENTPIWKSNISENEVISEEKYLNTLKAALVYLGWNSNSGAYTFEESANIRSCNCKDVIYKANVYRFPVRDNFKFKDAYLKNDVVHYGEELFEGFGVSHIKLKDFGNDLQPATEGLSNLDETCEVQW